MTSTKTVWSVRINLHVQLLAKHIVRHKLCCTSSNVNYLISCKLCKERCVDYAFKGNFKPRFRVHKSDVIKIDVVRPNIFLLTVLIVTKLKTLKFNWLNKCKRVIITLKVSCGVEKSIGKPSSSLYLMEWMVDRTGTVPVEKATEKRNC